MLGFHAAAGDAVALGKGKGETLGPRYRVRPLKSRMGAVPIVLSVGERPEVPAV